MPWSPTIKRALLSRCGRHCCVCGKFCGINIEIDHIIPEAAGGPSTEDNGIPVCFDCHAGIKHYNDSHPRGTKFTPDELRLHRDRTFFLVQSGALYQGRACAEPLAAGIATDNWHWGQASTICSYDFPFPIPLKDGIVEKETSDRLFLRLQQIIGMAYWVTAHTTPYDDFVYLLSFEPIELPLNGFKVFRTELHCHLTSFVAMFQAKCEQELEHKAVQLPAALDNVPDGLELTMQAQGGKFVPYRISRHGPRSVWLRELVTRPHECPPVSTTSGLLALLHGVLNRKTIIWDDFKWTKETEKTISFMATISDSGGFSFNQITLDRNDPERWEATDSTE